MYGTDDLGGGFTFLIDFSNLHEKDCWGAWDPTMRESNYHLWSLN